MLLVRDGINTKPANAEEYNATTVPPHMLEFSIVLGEAMEMIVSIVITPTVMLLLYILMLLLFHILCMYVIFS